MTEQLKPCPFCGESESFYVEHMEGTTKRPAYRVYCDNCGASHRFTDRGDHIENWNRRAGQSQPETQGVEVMSLELKRTILEQQDTIRSQQHTLNGLAEMLGVEPGDVDGLITRAEQVCRDARRYQFLKNIRVFRMFSADMSGKHTFATVGRPIGNGRSIDEAIDAEINKALAAGEAG